MIGAHPAGNTKECNTHDRGPRKAEENWGTNAHSKNLIKTMTGATPNTGMDGNKTSD